jgi:hypothetical protein
MPLDYQKLSYHEFRRALENVLFKQWEAELEGRHFQLTRDGWREKLRAALEPEAFAEATAQREYAMRVAIANEDLRSGEEPPAPTEYELCVHTEHCCVDHGCKYGNDECPVETGAKPQSYFCESCQLPVS